MIECMGEVYELIDSSSTYQFYAASVNQVVLFFHKGMSVAQELFFPESDHIWTTVKLSLSTQKRLADHS